MNNKVILPKSANVLKFGWPNEQMTIGGDYIFKPPGFYGVAINRFYDFVIWQQRKNSRIHRRDCGGSLLMCITEVHNLMQQNGIELPLPQEVT